MGTSLCHREFVDEVRPILESGDFDLLLGHIQHRWPNSSLRELLFTENEDAAKISLFCLSLTGTMDDCPAVASLLRCEDSFVRELAEKTLWSIWFRSGGEDGNAALQHAVQLVGQDRLDEALVLLNRLIDRSPGFAEARNQRAIVLFLLGHYGQAQRDLLQVLRLNPLHFAAAAGLGHCHAAAGQWEKALAWYQRAARIHPAADGLQEAIGELTRLFVRPAAAVPRSQCPVAEANLPEPE